MAKAGYYGGNPEKLLEASVTVVLNILHFENFEQEYEAAYYEMNRGAES